MGEKRMSLLYNSDRIVMGCIANIKKSTRHIWKIREQKLLKINKSYQFFFNI